MARPRVAVLCLLWSAFAFVFASAFVRYTDVYIGTPVACSPEEKFCFGFNLLYNADSGKCSELFAPCADGLQKLVVSKEQLTGPEPTLKVKCGARRCARHLESLFWPRGECLAPAAADAACENSSRTLNLFGEWECWCPADADAAAAPCPVRAPRPQPPDADRCAVPDLWQPAPPAPTVAHGACSQDDFHCYNRSQLSFQGACVTPLSRGPCAEGQWVALRAADGVLVSACAPRPCPDESHVAIGAACHPKALAQRLLCQDAQELVVDAFGYGYCEKKGVATPFALPNVRENGVCSVRNAQADLVTPASVVQPPASSTPVSSVPLIPLQPTTISSPSSPSSAVVSPEVSTPSAVSQPASLSTVAPSSESSTPSTISPPPSPSSVVVSPEASTPSSESKTPSDVTPPQLIDPLPCSNPPCVISPAITPTPNTFQASSPEVVAAPAGLGNVEAVTPAGQITIAGEVNQMQLLISQKGTSPSEAPPDSIQSQPPSSILGAPSQELVAPDVTAPEKQLTNGESVIAQAVEGESVGAILQKQPNYDTATPTQVPGSPGASNPSEQGSSAVGNVEVTQQLIEQPQFVSTTTVPNSELVSGTVIQTLPSIPAAPVVATGPEQNVLLAERAPVSQSDTPVTPQLLEQSQIYPLGSSVQLEQASAPAAFVPTNVAPAVSLQSGDAIVSLLPQQPVQGNDSPSPVQIPQSDPSVRSTQTESGVPVIPPQSPNVNIPIISLQPHQENLSPGLVQNTQAQIPISSVQSGRGDVVVDYVLVGQSNIPGNSV